MATSSKLYEDGSDQKCSESCGLRYGLSDEFEHSIIDEHKIKTSKAQIKSQIFHNWKEKGKYKHMMKDVILKTFDEESEKKIFRKFRKFPKVPKINLPEWRRFFLENPQDQKI